LLRPLEKRPPRTNGNRTGRKIAETSFRPSLVRPMKVAILQPGYLPWLGFFEQMHRCDLFVVYDDVQYTKKDWRNRNYIKTRYGRMRLTVPVLTKGKYRQRIRDARIDHSQNWKRKHLKNIRVWYEKAPYFHAYYDDLLNIYSRPRTFLIDLDMDLILWLCKAIGLDREIVFSSSLNVGSTDRQDRILEICRRTKANLLYDGHSARNFIEPGRFDDAGVRVHFQDYHHPYYHQLWLKEQGFIPKLSTLDLLFNHGPASLAILTGDMVVPGPDLPHGGGEIGTDPGT